MTPRQFSPTMEANSPMWQPKKQRRRRSRSIFISVGVMLALVICAGAAVAFQTQTFSHAATDSGHVNRAAPKITTINGLTRIAQVGSTANVLNAQGKKITVDPNPYKIAVAPSDLPSGIKAGDILVSNIGNEDHGTTLIKFTAQKGPGHLFNAKPNGLVGPAGVVFDQGKLFVANSNGNDVLVFNPNGTLFATLKNRLFNGPWGITAGANVFEGQNKVFSFFTSNKIDAKILRVDVIFPAKGAPEFHVTQVGQFGKTGVQTKIDLHWMPNLKVGNHILQDVLLAIDPANNRIAAFAHSSLLHSTGKGTTIFQGKPLNLPNGLGINPLNGDLLVVNAMDNNLIELNPTTGKVVGVKQIDPAKVDKQGNGSALFGVVGIKDQRGNLRVFFTNDNTNTLNVLSVS